MCCVSADFPPFRIGPSALPWRQPTCKSICSFNVDVAKSKRTCGLLQARCRQCAAEIDDSQAVNGAGLVGSA